MMFLPSSRGWAKARGTTSPALFYRGQLQVALQGFLIVRAISPTTPAVRSLHDKRQPTRRTRRRGCSDIVLSGMFRPLSRERLGHLSFTWTGYWLQFWDRLTCPSSETSLLRTENGKSFRSQVAPRPPCLTSGPPSREGRHGRKWRPIAGGIGMQRLPKSALSSRTFWRWMAWIPRRKIRLDRTASREGPRGMCPISRHSSSTKENAPSRRPAQKSWFPSWLRGSGAPCPS